MSAYPGYKLDGSCIATLTPGMWMLAWEWALARDATLHYNVGLILLTEF